MDLQGITPFLFTLDSSGHHAVYHGALKSEAENRLAQLFEDERHLPLEPIAAMPGNVHVINLSGMGPAADISTVVNSVAEEDGLVAYTGTAIQSQGLSWMDIHHSQGSKGNGINTLREELGFNDIIVFGDGDNDLSMFAVADECYATANADDEVKGRALFTQSVQSLTSPIGAACNFGCRGCMSQTPLKTSSNAVYCGHPADSPKTTMPTKKATPGIM
jgi:hypothetical protein